MGLDLFIHSQHYTAMTPGGRAYSCHAFVPLQSLGGIQVDCYNSDWRRPTLILLWQGLAKVVVIFLTHKFKMQGGKLAAVQLHPSKSLH